MLKEPEWGRVAASWICDETALLSQYHTRKGVQRLNALPDNPEQWRLGNPGQRLAHQRVLLEKEEKERGREAAENQIERLRQEISRSGERDLYRLVFARFPHLEVDEAIELAERAERMREKGEAAGLLLALESLAGKPLPAQAETAV